MKEETKTHKDHLKEREADTEYDFTQRVWGNAGLFWWLRVASSENSGTTDIWGTLL